MIGTLSEVYDSMEKGVYDFCVDGKCSGCGQCCTALLPISDKELRIIKRYISKKHVTPAIHAVPLKADLDLTCPFLDESKDCDKCKIYPVRPKICRTFQCNQPPSKIRENKEMFWKTRKPYFMWGIFKEVKS